jgi:cupin 2 domain-containing protein
VKKNLFDIEPIRDRHIEQFDLLIEGGDLRLPGGFRLERILSFGQTTGAGEWYDQPWAEWVAVIRGMAVLLFDTGESVTLRLGDHLIIPAGRRHRVTFTSDDCFWLAFHYSEK